MEQWALEEAWDSFQIYSKAANRSRETLEWYDTRISRYQQNLEQILDGKIDAGGRLAN